MKRILVLLCVFVLFAASCGSDDEAAPSGDPVKFGFLNGQSGDYGAWGGWALAAAEVAIEEINAAGGILGRPVELVVEDNQSTAEGAVTGFAELTEVDGIHALGGIESDGMIAVFDTVHELQLPTVCSTCGTTELDTTGGDFVWRIISSDTDNGIVSAQVARDSGYESVAMLVELGEGTSSPANVFKTVFEDQINGTITEDVRFDAGRSSYSAEVALAFESGADAVYVSVGFETAIPILNEWQRRGYGDVPLLVSTDLLSPDIATIIAGVDGAIAIGATGAYDTVGNPAWDAYVPRFEEKIGDPPEIGFYDAWQYDQYIMLALAMEMAGTTDGSAVAAAMPQVTNGPGVEVWTYAEGLAELAKGNEIDLHGVTSNLDLNAQGNLESPVLSVLGIVDGDWAVTSTLELDPALTKPERNAVAAPSGDPVKFGFLNGQSGDYGAWGGWALAAAEVAIEEINAAGGILGRPVELVVEDNQSTAEGAVTGFAELTEVDGIHALGGIESDGMIAVFDTVHELQLPTVCSTCGTTELDTTGGDFVWRIISSDTDNGIVSAQVARDSGYESVAMLVELGEGTSSPANVFKTVFEDQINGTITEDVRFDAGRSSYSAEVALAFESGADAVYVSVGFETAIPILNEWQRRGYGDVPLLVSTDLLSPDIATIIAGVDGAIAIGATGAYDTVGNPAWDAYVPRFEEKIGDPPEIGFYDAWQYDQYIMLALAMEMAGTTDGSAVAAAMPQVTNGPGVEVWTYAEGLAELAKGNEIDLHGVTSNLDLNAQGNLESPVLSVLGIVDGDWAVTSTLELDPALTKPERN